MSRAKDDGADMILQMECAVPRDLPVVVGRLLSKLGRNTRAEQHQPIHPQPVVVLQETAHRDLLMRYAKQQVNLLQHPALGVQRASGRCWSGASLTLVAVG